MSIIFQLKNNSKRKGFVYSNNCCANMKLDKNREASDLDFYCLYEVLF